MNQNDLESRTVTIERRYQAPLELVWEAWTDAAHIAQWWGPKGMETVIHEHDFVEGGKWKYSMQMPNGQDFVSEGQFTEIVQHERIVMTADFKPMTENVILEVHLARAGEDTVFTFKVIHPTEAYKLAQEKMGIYNGWGSAFDRLEAFLATT